MSEIEKRRRTREQQEGSAGGGAMPPAGMQVIPQDIMARRQFQREADKAASEEMHTRGAMPGQGPTAATPGQAPEAEVRAVRTGADEAAYNLGAKIGAQSMIPEGMGAARRGAEQGGINKEKLIEAERLLMQYKNGKSSVDRRIINAQQWWKIRNWEQIENERGTQGATTHKSSTAWLWNCIVGKHADAMDSFPEPVILPRM